MRIFGDYARIYYDAGFSPIPLGKPGSSHAKRAVVSDWQGFGTNRPSREQIDEWSKKFSDNNIGIGMGSRFGDYQIVGIDIDNEEYQEAIERAIGRLVSGKIGAKGVTWFVLAELDIKNKSFTRKGEGAICDILAEERQAAMPPSIHPDTNESFRWVGKPLYEIDIKELPVVNISLIKEISYIAQGRAAFLNGGMIKTADGVEEEVDGINHMVWAGPDRGGTTHDNRLRAIGFLVSDDWTDEQVESRLMRAMREAWDRAREEGCDFEPDWDRVQSDHKKMIEGARSKQFGKDRKATRGKKAPLERVISDWAVDAYDPIVYDGARFLVYNKGHWPEVDEALIRRKMFDTFDVASRSDVSNAISILADKVFVKDFGMDTTDKICMGNGTLDVMTMEVSPWEPSDELLHKLDFDWDDEATCEVYNKFMRTTFNDDQEAIDCFEEFAGLTTVDDMRFQKMLFLLGPGGNGKSTVANLLASVHAPSAVSAVPITSLDDERHRTSLVGKLLNISSEQSRLNVVSDTVLKQITGGDTVPVRKLFKEIVEIQLKARLLCLANNMPATNDTSVAMRRRLLILNCPNIIEEKDKDTSLLEKLKDERPAILKRWIIALRRLRERGRFEEPESSKKAVAEYFRNASSFAMWLADSVTLIDPSESPSKWTPITELFIDYVEFSKDRGFYRHANIGMFIQDLRGHNIEIHQLTLPSKDPKLAYVAQVCNLSLRPSSISAVRDRVK